MGQARSDWDLILTMKYKDSFHFVVAEGETPHKVTWSDYMEAALSKAAPDCCFKHVSANFNCKLYKSRGIIIKIFFWHHSLVYV